MSAAHSAMTAPTTMGANKAGKAQSKTVGITPEERRRVAEEINSKRRKQNEQRELILKQFADEHKQENQQTRVPVPAPFPAPAVPSTASSNQAAFVRIQLRNRNNQTLVCSCFGPENTIREVLDFGNSEMPSSGRIMRPEFHPSADPQFVERTQQMLREAQAQQAGAGGAPAADAGPEQAQQREVYVALRLTYPPRTRYEGADLDQTLRSANLIPSCTLLLEESRQEGDEPTQAQGTGAFAPARRYRYGDSDDEYSEEEDMEPRRDGGDNQEDEDEDEDGAGEEDEGENEDEDDHDHDAGPQIVGRGFAAAQAQGGHGLRSHMRSNRPVTPPQAPSVPLSAEDRQKMREAAAKRFAEAPKTVSCSPPTASSSSTAPQPRVPVTVPGSKTKAIREEEKKLILQRANEERREREERLRKVPAVANVGNQSMDVDTRQTQKKLQVRHPKGTEDVALEDDTTFEMVFTELREKLHLEDGDWSFRTNYPVKRWASGNEQAQQVASEVTLPCVVILERANPSPVVEPSMVEHPPTSAPDPQSTEHDDDMGVVENPASGEVAEAPPQPPATEEELASAARERQREARLAALRAAETRFAAQAQQQPAQVLSPVEENSGSSIINSAEATVVAGDEGNKRTAPKPKSSIITMKKTGGEGPLQPQTGHAGLSYQQRKKREDDMARERRERDAEKQRILEEMAADRAFREARAKVEIPITTSSAAPLGTPATSQRLGNLGNSRNAPSAGSGAQPGSAASDGSQAPDGEGENTDSSSTLRVRHPDGSIHFPVVTATSTLRQILNMSPDEFIAVIPFPRDRLQGADWDAPLANFPNIFPSGTIVLHEIAQIGQQQQGGPIDPFSPDEIASALPPALNRRNSEVQKRLRTFRSRTFEASERPRGADDEEAEKCGICLCVFQASERMAMLKCNHEFHWDCMERSIQYSNQCPTCRQDIVVTRKQP